MNDMAFQGSLFSQAGDPETFDREFREMRRIQLSDDAWIDRQPGWAKDPDGLFLTAMEALDWKEGTERIRGEEIARPRLVARFDRSDLPPGLEVIGEMSDVLSERYGVALDRITANLYRNGSDSVAWHGDRIARELPEAT
ncbi:MAG: alpha-ketoglutarate-dependent dioxygenase AlkB, partial [bacterium]